MKTNFQYKRIDLTNVDSKDELYFEWWLQELKENGYIKSYNRSISYELVPKSYMPVLKRKPTIKEPDRLILEAQHFLHPVSYTPDYDIYWEQKAIGIFVLDIDELFIKEDIVPYFYGQKTDLGLYSCTDVKPIFFRAQNSSSITFPIKKKIMWNKYSIYVNKTVPIGKEELFCSTFTPNRFLFQDMKPEATRKLGRKMSKGKWKSGWTPIDFEDFINDFKRPNN